jgi:hypothetical protein
MKYTELSDLIDEFNASYLEAREVEGYNLEQSFAMSNGRNKVMLAWMLQDMDPDTRARWIKKLQQRIDEERSTIVAKQNQPA